MPVAEIPGVLAPEPEAPPEPPQLPERRGWLGGFIALIAAGWLVLVAVLLASGGTSLPGTAPRTASPATPAALAAGPAGSATAPDVERFDDRPIDSAAPPPWSVTGSGAASVVALPTSVDRSLRLRSSASGAPVSACRSLDQAATSLTLAADVLVEAQPPAAAPLIEMTTDGQSVAVVQVDHDGALAPGDAGIGRVAISPTPSATRDAPAAQRWQHVEVVVDGPAVRVCISSPAGAPSGWVAVDNVAIG